MINNHFLGGISFSNILGGISKALNTANEIIPIYNNAKPMIKKGREIVKTLNTLSFKESVKNDNIVPIKENKKGELNNLPVFFS